MTAMRSSRAAKNVAPATRQACPPKMIQDCIEEGDGFFELLWSEYRHPVEGAPSQARCRIAACTGHRGRGSAHLGRAGARGRRLSRSVLRGASTSTSESDCDYNDWAENLPGHGGRRRLDPMQGHHKLTIDGIEAARFVDVRLGAAHRPLRHLVFVEKVRSKQGSIPAVQS